jgi:hypothetical protein
VEIRKIDTFVILEETRHILNMKPVEGQNSSPAELTHTSATPALGEMNTGTGVFAVVRDPLVEVLGTTINPSSNSVFRLLHEHGTLVLFESHLCR